MKRNLLSIAFLFTFVLIGSACKKCYECTTNTATVVTTGPYTNTTTTNTQDEFCGSKDEKAEHEFLNTGTTSVGVPGASTSVEVRTNCNPK
jgi:hypothetical protein